MGKEDFKNAAAKLLAQHSVKGKKTVVALPSAVRSEVSPGSVSPPIKNLIAPALLPEMKQEHSQNAPTSKSSSKLYILVGLAILGCAIMVLLVPETIFGIGGNAAVGIAAGVGFGLIINWES